MSKGNARGAERSGVPLFASGFTHEQVVEYYRKVARWMVPHLKGRPVTLKRFPDGLRGEHFYEKDAPSFTPHWVRRIPVPRRAGGPAIQYIGIDNARTLVWCAEVHTVEFHPFLHRAGALDAPDSVVFDLDPGEGADLMLAVEAALTLRELLERLRLACFAKVSGSKGVQVYVPLHTPVTYDLTQAFARAVAQLLEREHPERFVAEMPKHLRTKKVFVDWSQNSDYKTTVGVYSIRAKRSRPFVSMPFTWDELGSLPKSDLYLEPEEALARLRQQGDLFAPVLKLRQSLPETFVRELAGPQSEPKSLKTYRQKRDFAATPEPAPAPPRPSRQGSRRRFVVQKHAASHLHYDFRLEMQGVLRSWAVPKGVPLKAGERRLAAATEDHPIDYLDFEGVIPQGQYGGGTVMVWDIGTYELIEGNYFRGRLRFHLAGNKLDGEWELVREDDKNWRLIKTGESIAAVAEDESAVSGRSMAEIAAAKDRTWQSNRAPQAELPPLPFLEPMLAKLAAKLPEPERWQYEIKFDGYRTLLLREAGGVRLLSRNRNDMTARFAAIAEAAAALPAGCIVDGEVVALDERGRPSFNRLQHGGSSGLVYYAFDLLAEGGREITGEPLERRRQRLRAVLAGTSAPILFSEALEAEPEALLQAAREQGLEGIVAKRRGSRYEPGRRSGAWLKVKTDQGHEFVIGGYKPGAGGFENLAAGYYDDAGRLIFIAKVKNGFTPKLKAEIAMRFPALETGECPFANLPEPKSARRGEALTADAMKKYRWLKPELVAHVEFTDWTDADHLRHSRFVALRDDKDPREVVREIAR